jgi:high-affinity K+ transport system ATPase subunit B
VAEARSLFDGEILRHALVDAFKKFDPRDQIKNPVMFVVLIGSSSPSSRPSPTPASSPGPSPSGCS